MELFPAADEEQFQFIKRIIDDCDYYLLIIGGRYGSVSPDGMSYTEKEYDYAVSLPLRVIALIHDNPDEIPLGKSEKEPVLREKLERFKAKVRNGRMVKPWKSPEQLPALVTSSLSHTIRIYPAVGWVRANKAASLDLLTQINELRKQNDELRAAATEFQPTIENLAGLEEQITLYGTFYRKAYAATDVWNATFTWAEIFAGVSPYLVRFPSDESVKLILSAAGYARSGNASTMTDNLGLDDQNFRTVAVQLEALGLVKLQYTETTTGGMGLFWAITPPGQRLMTDLRTIKKIVPPQQIGKIGEGR